MTDRQGHNEGESQAAAPQARTAGQAEPARERAQVRRGGFPSAWWWLIVILAAAAALRLAVFAAGPARNVNRAVSPDSRRYVELAGNLYALQSFGRLTGEQEGTYYYPLEQLRLQRGEAAEVTGGVHPEIMRSPGYPAFLAAMRAAGLSPAGAVLVQCILDVCAVALVYAVAVRLFNSRRACLLAAAIVAIHPGAIVGANFILTETLFGFLLLAGAACVLRALRGDSPWRPAVLGGLLLGCAALVRPVGVLVGPGLAMWVALKRRGGKGAVAGVVVLAASLLPAGLWAWRNARVGYGFTVTNVSTVHLAKTAAFMEMYDAGQTDYPKDYWPHYDAVVEEVADTITDGETVDSATTRVVRQRIAARPLTYCKLLGDSAAKFMLDHSMGELCALLGKKYEPSGLRDRLLGRGEGKDANVKLSSLAGPLLWTCWNAALCGLMLAGLLCMGLRHRWSDLLLIGGMIVYFVLATQYQGLERMRLPVLAFQAVAVASLAAPLRPKPAEREPAATSVHHLQTRCR